MIKNIIYVFINLDLKRIIFYIHNTLFYFFFSKIHTLIIEYNIFYLFIFLFTLFIYLFVNFIYLLIIY